MDALSQNSPNLIFGAILLLSVFAIALLFVLRSKSNQLRELEIAKESERKNLEIEKASALTINQPFQLRRKGVETKIILGNAPPEIDQTLIRNIVKAMEWFEAIKSGETFTQIAARAGTSKRRVQDVIDLTFLAPDIIDKAINGTLPLHITSDYLIKAGVPADWNMQRNMLGNPALTTVRS